VIIFDIETEAHPDARRYVKAKAPANYKDPTKIAEFVAAKTREEIEHAALDPDLCTVRAIGVLPIAPADPALTFIPDPVVMIVGDGWTEPEMIRNFWELLWAHRGECVGYNILGFDFPVLLHRSMELGIQAMSHHNLALDFAAIRRSRSGTCTGSCSTGSPGAASSGCASGMLSPAPPPARTGRWSRICPTPSCGSTSPTTCDRS